MKLFVIETRAEDEEKTQESFVDYQGQISSDSDQGRPNIAGAGETDRCPSQPDLGWEKKATGECGSSILQRQKFSDGQ